MSKALVIVESPAKARTISKYLGADFAVESSVGHIRDLPSNAAEIPAEFKDEPWSRLGVNVEDDFKPLYVVPKDKKAQVTKLRKLLKGAVELYLATDEDREGEAIAWHLVQVLKPKVPVKRMVFDEITKSAITQAVDATRDIDQGLVSAQETRRVLDRLFGYEVSPVLWRKVGPKLSAGRVQSVATRLMVDRERARMRFVSAAYWDLDTVLEDARRRASRDRRAAGGVGRAAGGQRQGFRRNHRGKLKNADAVRAAGRERQPSDWRTSCATRISAWRKSRRSRSPTGPTRRSLRRRCSRRRPASCGFPPSAPCGWPRTLYENGYITYMRTDSTNLSSRRSMRARAQIRESVRRRLSSGQPRRIHEQVARTPRKPTRRFVPRARPSAPRKACAANSRHDAAEALRPDLEAHGGVRR
jgi:DNA topoisomerase-1